MNEDPTRMMRRPDDHNPHGNMRLVVAGLVAVILGLVIAIAVISSGDDDDTGSVPATVTTVPTETTEETTAETTEETTPTETDTTETTPTDTTTTTETTTAPEEEDDGSGGIEAP